MRAKIRSSRSQLYIRGSLCVDDCSTDGAVTHLGTGVYLNKNPSAIYIDSMEQNISGSLSRVGSRREAKKAVRNLIYQDKSLALAFLHADFCSLLSKGGIIENSTLPPQYFIEANDKNETRDLFIYNYTKKNLSSPPRRIFRCSSFATSLYDW